jgi:hypothetical protein
MEKLIDWSIRSLSSRFDSCVVVKNALGVLNYMSQEFYNTGFTNKILFRGTDEECKKFCEDSENNIIKE